MSRSGVLFPGVLACLALSLAVTVILPYAEGGKLSPQYKEEDGRVVDSYPVEELGTASRGKEVYIAQGCQTCHTQVVRGADTADVERGWGVRKSVQRDFIFENPPVVGAVRLGPDLANVGAATWRNEQLEDPFKPAKRDAEWHMLHLYHPTVASKNSNMPCYDFLFKKHRIAGSGSKDALKLPKDVAVEGGYEVIPTPDAKALVAYLLSLDRSHSLKEAPVVATAAPSK